MGRIIGAGASKSYGHRWKKLESDVYRLTWVYDRKFLGSRLRHPQSVSRDTDHAGAVRFAKKWGISLPDSF